MKATILPCILAAAISSGCATKLSVHHVKASVPTSKRGIYYALPRTVVSCDVTIARESFRPGIYADTEFAKSKYPTDQIPVESSLKFSIDKVSIDSRAEPDPSEVYLVEIPTREFLPFRTRSFETTTGTNGLLSKATVEVSDETVEVALNAVAAAAGIVGRAAKFELKEFSAEAIEEEKCDKEWNDPRNKNACHVFSEIATLRKHRQALLSGEVAVRLNSSDTLASLLKELDREIANLEHNNFTGVTLIKSESRHFEFVPQTGTLTKELFTFSEDYGVCELSDSTAKPFSKPYQYMCSLCAVTQQQRIERSRKSLENYRKSFEGASNALDKAEEVTKARCGKDFKDDFGGTEGHSTDCRIAIEVEREARVKMSQAREALVRATLDVGRLERDKDRCESAKEDCDNASVVTLELVPSTGSMADQVSAANKGDPNGFFYRVPSVNVVKVKSVASSLPKEAKVSAPELPGTEHARERIAVAQLGRIVAVPQTIAGRNMKYSLGIDTNTGALTNFTLNTKAAFDKTTVGEAKSAAEAVLDVKTNSYKQQTERLNAEKSLLEARKALEELKKSDGGSAATASSINGTPDSANRKP